MLVHCADLGIALESLRDSAGLTKQFNNLQRQAPFGPRLCKLRHRCHVKFHSRFLDWVKAELPGRGGTG